MNLSGKDVPYESIFNKIERQVVSDLPQLAHIYHGWAFINRLRSGYGYQIKFRNKLKNEDSSQEYITTIMIADRLIEQYKMKNW